VRFLSIVLLFGVFLALSGCGKGFSVTGKVAFPDGTPLTTGYVCFENATMTLTGTINSSGQYQMTGASPGEGVPAGEYQVYISGAVQPGNPNTGPVELDADGNALVKTVDKPDIPLIDAKFTRKSSSGLQCEVKGKTTFNIEVTKP
jgi:hypothetical protein